MASSYSNIVWSFTGYKSQAEAEKGLADMMNWFRTSHPDHNDWNINSSVSQTTYGFRALAVFDKGGI